MDVHQQTSGNDYIVPSFINSTTILCSTITVLASLVWLFKGSTRRLPPGPPLLVPGIGHIFLLAKDPLKKLRALHQKYGDIFRMYLGTRLVIFINGYDVINEVLQNRGPEFAHRPPMFLAEKLAQFKGILNTSGSVWMEHRTSIMRTMRALASKGGQLDHTLETEVNRLSTTLKTLARDGGTTSLDLKPLMTKSTCSIAFTNVYGRTLSYDSKELTIYTEILDELFRNFGLLAMVNFIPFVHHLPGDPVCYRRTIQLVDYLETEVVKPEIQRLIEEYHDSGLDANGNIRKSFSGTSTVSFAGRYLEDLYSKRENNISTEMSEEQLIKAAGDMIAGGYESTSTTLLWLVLYFIHHPEVQECCRKEAQQALHSCGGRLTEVNRHDLVYTQATIMEVQRLANVAPLPPAHCCSKDTTIQGYTIPKDAMILTNMDSLMMGKEVGDDRYTFRPERFISDNGELKYQKWFMPYSTGTRMCLGASIAKKELLTFTVGLVSRFRFQAPVVEGKATMPSLEGDLGLTHIPKPYTVRVESVQ